MIVNRCGNCPFLVEEYDPNAAANDTLYYCNLIQGRSNIIVSYDSFEKDLLDVDELKTVLENCPLLEGEINIKYEKI